MKFSHYNFIVPYNNDYLLYNSLSEQMLVISKELHERILSSTGCAEVIHHQHPSLYKALKSGGFIVADSKDEYNDYAKKLMREGHLETCSNFRLTINPTMDCNLRCWYCYEEKERGSVMSRDVMQNTFDLIHRITSNKALEHLSLSFFGGEPLMKYRQVILPIIKRCKYECQTCNVDLSIHFTTNAVLLSRSMTDELIQYHIPLSFQVPFDGDEAHHNQTKYAANGTCNSYKTSLKNVKYALSQGCTFVIRLNCTRDNIRSFKTLVDEFSSVEDKDRVIFSVQTIWQETDLKFIRDQKKTLYDYIFSRGFNHHSSSIPPTKCYADSQNSLVINYNGNVYKCTAINFTEANREGVLGPCGQVTLNDKYTERLNAIYGDEVCNECKLFPICDICTQHKLRMKAQTGSFSECSIPCKEEILTRRLSSLISYYENR